MDVREATTEDGDAIRRIARDSLEASYSLSPRAIEGAVAEWYDAETFEGKLDEDNTLFLVAGSEGDVRGFSESDLVSEGGNGDLLWLHVDPAYRGRGVGTTLFERTRGALLDMGAARLRAKVLDDNAEGNAFYADLGFERVDTDRVEIDDDSYLENIYIDAETAESTAETEPASGVGREVRTPDGRTAYVNTEEVERGSKAPFYTAYTDAELTAAAKYGYFCANCETLDNAMDAMGRVKCNTCGNLRKATRWDATYG